MKLLSLIWELRSTATNMLYPDIPDQPKEFILGYVDVAFTRTRCWLLWGEFLEGNDERRINEFNGFVH